MDKQRTGTGSFSFLRPGVRRLRDLLSRSRRTRGHRDPLYYPHLPGAFSYVLPRSVDGASGSRAVPPRETWISEKYGKTAEEYLESGRRDVQQMRGILAEAGVSLEEVGNILDFGCADGRMIRWLEPLAERQELWGTDIHAGRIAWCKQHLGPAFHFLTNTTVPHLPFEDRYFGFVYAGSVFTHIDDLADSWFAELRRILRPGGKLFVTVHLENDIALLRDKYPHSDLARWLHGTPEYHRYASTDFGMFTINRMSASTVFYNLDYLKERLEPMYRVLSVSEEVRFYQNGLLLERQ